MPKFTINSKSVAHIATQIRAKQLETRNSQYKIQKSIVDTYEKNQANKSGEVLGKQIVQNVKESFEVSKTLNDYLKIQNVNDIGFPIKFNKTHLQLEMAYEYAKKQDNLITQIKNAHFYNNQYCSVNSTELPLIQSDSVTSYWGNKNPSISSVLLASANASLDNKDINMPGAATFYPF